MKKKITILIPCFNEQDSLPSLCESLLMMANSQGAYDWEFLFVNDGSSDDTLNIIKLYKERDTRISYLDLSRNFGKENAMLAGFDYATGDCVVIIDADLQNPPTLIPDMIALWEQGVEDVYARRLDRGKESWLRRKLSLMFYSLLQKVSKLDILENFGDFRLLDRKCIDALKKMREHERYTKGMYCWIGFKKQEITFERNNRMYGKSSMRFGTLFNLAIDGVVSFTTIPLRLAAIADLIISVFAFIYMCYFLMKTFLFGDPVQGFPTLIIVILFLGGANLLFLGVIGEYISKIYSETRNRPIYIVREYR